jgi:hypothetical protein
MATSSPTADRGALVVRPPRVNIFAKADAREEETAPDARRGVFDDAAACPSADRLADRFVAASDDGTRRHGGVPAGRRLVCLVALAAATAGLIFAIAPQPRSHSAVAVPAAPSLSHGQRGASHATERRSSPPRVSKHGRPRRHHTAARASRSSNSAHRRPRPPREVAPPSARHVAPPRRDPSVPAPTNQPVPKRVAPDAPPEFM